MKQLLRFLTLLCAFNLVTPSRAYPVVIIVHGSFASQGKWWNVRGGFFQALEKQAKAKGHCVVPFSWSGQPKDQEIMIAGAMLAKLIESYSVSERIILIGHSHGGNVINYASKLLFDPLQHLSAQLANKPVSELLDQAQAQIAAHPVPNNQNFIPVPATSLHWWDLLPTVRSLVQGDYRVPVDHQKRYLIESVYLLATPTDIKMFNPQMEIIGTVLNLFSYGDYIQPVFGMYQRTYPQHPRLINLEMFTWDHRKKKLHKPNHHEIHASEIGQWLLAVPEDVKLLGSGGFEKFKFGIDAKIVFKSDGPPEFVV